MMLPTDTPPHSRFRRIAALLLLLGALLSVLLVARLVANPPPMQVSEQSGAATITFSLDRSQVVFPSECIHAAWTVEGIRAVYINGEATVGSGERELCPWASHPVLRVILQDATERTYTLPVRVLSYTPLVWALLASIITCLAGTFILASPLSTIRAKDRLSGWKTQSAMLLRVFLSHPLLVVGLFTLAGAVLRLAQIGTLSLVLDEAAIWQFTHGSLSETLQNNAFGNSAPPLFALLLHIWQWGGQSEMWLRLLPALASIAAIPAIYALGRRLFDRTAGYGAALLIAFAAPQVEYAQYLREYSLAVLLAILALYAYTKLRELQPRFVWISVWILCLFTQYGLVLLVAALDLLWTIEILRKPDRSRLIRWLGTQIILAVALAVVYSVALRFQLGGGTGTSWYSVFYWDGLPASLGNYILGGFGGLLALSFGTDAALVGFGALAAVGLAVVLTGRRNLLPLLFLPILAALIAGILGYYPYTGLRQMTFVTPLFLLAAAGGLSYFVRLRETPLRLLAAVTLVVGVLGGLVGVSAFYARPGFDQVRPVIETLKAARWETDAIFVIPPYIDPLLDYYLAQNPALREAYTRAEGSDPASYGAQLDALRSQYERVWVVMNCCEDGLQQYLRAHGDDANAFATNGNIALYLLD